MSLKKLTKEELLQKLDEVIQEAETLKETAAKIPVLESRLTSLADKYNSGEKNYAEACKIIEDLKLSVKTKDETITLLEQTADAIAKSPVAASITTIVIPYVKRFAQGNELLHAIRGWDENFKEDFQIVVVGDKEEWFADSILHIPHECNTKNPPLDIVEKMKLVIAHDDIPEEFIWTNDDIYPVTALSLADVKFLKCDGNLAKGYPHKGGIYATNKNRTYELLKDLKRPTYNYGTHTPMVFEKSKIQLLIERYHIDEIAHLVSCLYFNFFFPDMIPFQLNIATDNIKCGVYRPNPNVKVIEAALSGKKFINNSQSGYVKPLVEILDKRFATPCTFECEAKEQE